MESCETSAISHTVKYAQCIRKMVRTPAEVTGIGHICIAVSAQLRGAGIEASEAKLYPEYAPDYWATFFTDPDAIRLEVTNYRLERRERHDNWRK